MGLDVKSRNRRHDAENCITFIEGRTVIQLRQKYIYINIRMKMRNQEKQNFPLSNMLQKTKQCFSFHRSARFWFGSLLPVPDLNDPINIKFDIEKEEYMQLLKMLNFVAADLITMYQTNPPEDAFRLLYLIKIIFGLSNQNETSGFQGYQQLVAQVHLNNSLALFLIKHGQFAYAHECFQFILQVVKQDKIDIGSDIALTSISNYLAFIKIHQHSEMKQKMAQVIKCLHKIYKKLLSKYLAAGCLESSLMMMFSVYKQHQLYLGAELKEQNNLLLRKFEQSQRVENMHRSVDLSRNKEPIFQVGKQKCDIFLSRNIQYRRSDLEIKKVELYFFTSSLIFSKKSKTSKKQIIAVPERQRYSVQMKKNVDIMSQSTRLHHKTNHEDMDYLIIKLDDKKTQNFLHQSTIPAQSRIQKRQITTPRLNIKKVERKGSQTSQKSQISTVFAFSHAMAPKRIKKIDMQDSVILKVGECILEIIRDGIIISDFLRKNKSYLPWQKMLILIQNLRFSPLFSQFLPIQCLYDVARVLIPYIGQPINQQAVISQSPQQLIETETNTKIFHVESKYLKIFKMNNYDSNHIDLTVDCFIDEFDHYFDELNRNQYIDKLNSEIFGIPYKKRQYYSVKTYRKSKKLSEKQLFNQINMEKLEQFPYIGSSPFKFLMLMRKVQLLVYLKQKDLTQQKNNGYLPLTVVRLNKNPKQQRVLKLPMYKFKRYFVAQKDDLPNWMRKYGKILLQGYHRCFQDFEYAFSNLQYLNVKSYANKIQLVPAGRYLTPIVAQIIGSNDRIWGICIRRFQQSFVEQTVTFIYNPYFDLLRPVIGMKCYKDRLKILGDHLLEGKVSTTYKKLSDLKLTGKMINLFQFWSIIDF